MAHAMWATWAISQLLLLCPPRSQIGDRPDKRDSAQIQSHALNQPPPAAWHIECTQHSDGHDMVTAYIPLRYIPLPHSQGVVKRGIRSDRGLFPMLCWTSVFSFFFPSVGRSGGEATCAPLILPHTHAQLTSACTNSQGVLVPGPQPPHPAPRPSASQCLARRPTPPHPRSKFMLLKLDDLKEMCRANSLPPTGKKADLVNRLLEAGIRP